MAAHWEPNCEPQRSLWMLNALQSSQTTVADEFFLEVQPNLTSVKHIPLIFNIKAFLSSEPSRRQNGAVLLTLRLCWFPVSSSELSHVRYGSRDRSISGVGPYPRGSVLSCAEAALWANKITLMNRGGLVYSPCQGTLGVTDCQKRGELWRRDVTLRYPERWTEKRKSNQGACEPKGHCGWNKQDSELDSTLYLLKTHVKQNNCCLQRTLDLMTCFDLELCTFDILETDTYI